jgi:hypothetical protein
MLLPIAAEIYRRLPPHHQTRKAVCALIAAYSVLIDAVWQFCENNRVSWLHFFSRSLGRESALSHRRRISRVKCIPGLFHSRHCSMIEQLSWPPPRVLVQAASRAWPIISPPAIASANPIALSRFSISSRAVTCDMVGRVPSVISSRSSTAVSPRG